MEKVEFFVSGTELEYVLSDTEVNNSFIQEHASDEPPSVFYLSLNFKGEIYLPLTLFKSELTPFQTLIKYLRENLGLPNKKIAKLLARDTKAVWNAYKLVKHTKAISVEESPIQSPVQVPISIFKDDRLSTLEALVRFLAKLDLSYAEIGRLLGKDQRTIWTVAHRAKTKLGLKNENQ